jgi:uncharacterized membrane protein YvlD (DUF360 family)
MSKHVLRLLLTSAAFYFVFPVIPGVQFHGNLVHALLAGALFSFFGWIVEFLAITLSAVLAVSTLGMALIILTPAWLFGFWLLPAVVLRMVADLMPSTLQFSGWIPAIEGGLLMLVIGIVTGSNTHASMNKNGHKRIRNA